MASLVSKGIIVLKPENVAQLVFFIRGEKVMFDADLAMLYGVEVRSLNQAVARNRKRFPPDFAFQLADDELAALRSQLVISKSPTFRHRFPKDFVFQISEDEWKFRPRRTAPPDAEPEEKAIRFNLKELKYVR